jgi:predicted Holliday junction resolvase-like endonuclease
MNSWQKENAANRLRELQAEREYHLKALENIEERIKYFRERVA